MSKESAKNLQLDLILKYHNEDRLSLEKIAKIFNVSRKTLRIFLNDNHIKINKIIYKAPEILTKEELYNLFITQNLTRQQIADKYNISKRKVTRLLDKHHIVKDIKVKNEYDEEEFIRLYSVEKKSNSEIAKLLNLQEYRINIIAQKLGIYKSKNTPLPSPCTDKEFYDMYITKNMTLEEIASYLGVSANRVYKQCDKLKLHKDQYTCYKNKSKKKKVIKQSASEIRIQKLDLNEEKLRQLYITENKTCREIGEIYNISTMEAYKILDYFHISKDKKLIKEAIERTNLQRYGVKRYINSEKARETYRTKTSYDYPWQNPEVKAKVKTTKLERYSNENYNNMEKAKRTNLQRYGVESALQLPRIRESLRETCQERWGVDNSSQAEEIKELHKKRCKEKYGVEYYFQTDEFKNTVKNTCQEKYGADTVGKSGVVRGRIRNTLIQKYGGESPFSSEEIRQKSKETLIQNYGVDNPSKSEEIRKRTEQTCLERYGYKVASQSPKVIAKMQETNMDRYGVSCTLQVPEFKEKAQKTIIERYGVDHPMKCPEIAAKVFSCNGRSISKWEQSMVDYLRERYPDFEILQQYRDERYPYLCDCYIVDLDLFIEFNGSFYHNYRPFVESVEDVAEYDDMVSKGDIYAEIAEKWRYSDVEKRECAYRNGLNYLEYWEIDEDNIPFDPVERFLWEVEWCEKR